MEFHLLRVYLQACDGYQAKFLFTRMSVVNMDKQTMNVGHQVIGVSKCRSPSRERRYGVDLYLTLTLLEANLANTK